MRTHRLSLLLLCCLLLAALMTPAPAIAQRRPRAEINITSLKGESVRSPDFKASKDSPKDFWGQFVVKFDLKSAGNKDGWLDQLEVVWKVLATDREGKARLLALETVYEDIEEGTARKACIYLKPKFMRRFMGSGGRFSPGSYSIYCEMRIDGQRVASYDSTIAKHKPFGRWYTKDSDRERGQRYLIPKNRSPFAVIDYDSYECEKAAE